MTESRSTTPGASASDHTPGTASIGTEEAGRAAALHARVPDLDMSVALLAINDHTERRVPLLDALLDEVTGSSFPSRDERPVLSAHHAGKREHDPLRSGACRSRARNIASVPWRCPELRVRAVTQPVDLRQVVARVELLHVAAPTGDVADDDPGLGQVRRTGDVRDHPAGPYGVERGVEQAPLQPAQFGDVRGIAPPPRLGATAQRSEPGEGRVQHDPVERTRPPGRLCPIGGDHGGVPGGLPDQPGPGGTARRAASNRAPPGRPPPDPEPHRIGRITVVSGRDATATATAKVTVVGRREVA